MTERKNPFSRAQEGIKTLDIKDQYINSALENLEVWLTDAAFKEYVPQITHLINNKRWDFLLDSFYQVIPFGTGGRRGLVGIGPNRINLWTIQASAQGHSQFLFKQYGEKAKERGIVITYDVREFTQKGDYNDDLPNPIMNLNCKTLAYAALEVYSANGIRVHMFEDVRSTPELSFAIRHLNAVSGAMFSASHNLPSDNGKKVYDEFGGQLIPPHDQELVNEVTQNVKEIKILDSAKAEQEGFVHFIDKKVDEVYWSTVCSVSMIKERDIKILYSPLHGTGLTSVYPVLKQLDFNVELDPKTSYFSGAFENVTFNIPNPEVKESFDISIPEAEKIDADIILSTDPDADRIGIMVKYEGEWKFLNGNEIGIILTQYGISSYRNKNLLNENCIVITTEVTTSLIKKICKDNKIQCIADLLVGFKYIGDEMNKLGDDQIENFILGTEESHGYIIGHYAREKDAACAAVWISELAAKLKREKSNLFIYLEQIYAEYGYCHNYLTEIRLLGAKGMEQIALIMEHFRKTNIKSLGDFSIAQKIDRWDGDPFLSLTDKTSRDMLLFNIAAVDETQSIKVIVRPSGTEPKIKLYFEVIGLPCDLSVLPQVKENITNIRIHLEKAFMLYCYQILNIDFPERGFLLFWQLPLDDKLKYFEIEDQIVALKNISKKNERKNQLTNLLKFLGANPIQKVDNAFSFKFKTGINEYLDL